MYKINKINENVKCTFSKHKENIEVAGVLLFGLSVVLVILFLIYKCVTAMEASMETLPTGISFLYHFIGSIGFFVCLYYVYKMLTYESTDDNVKK